MSGDDLLVLCVCCWSLTDGKQDRHIGNSFLSALRVVYLPARSSLPSCIWGSQVSSKCIGWHANFPTSTRNQNGEQQSQARNSHVQNWVQCAHHGMPKAFSSAWNCKCFPAFACNGNANQWQCYAFTNNMKLWCKHLSCPTSEPPPAPDSRYSPKRKLRTSIQPCCNMYVTAWKPFSPAQFHAWLSSI